MRSVALTVVAVIYLLSLADSSVSAAPSPIRWYLTAFNSTNRLTEQSPIQWISQPDFPSGITYEVNSKVKFQTIEGFGAAFTESCGYILQMLPKDKQDYVLDQLWGENGLRYNLGRVHINSCDFSLKSYSFDDVVNDTKLEHFDDLVAHDHKYLLPMIKSALERQPKLQLIAAPWSPPAWMKYNQNMNTSPTPGLIREFYEPWASYIVRWLTAWKKAGVNIWAITPQNEPLANTPWESCVFSSGDQAAFIGKYLGPLLRKVHPEVKLYIYDHNKDWIYAFTKEVLGALGDRTFIDGVAFHWYSGVQFEELAALYKEFPDLPLLATEATNCPGVMLGAWFRGENYGLDIMGDLLNGATGWIDWNFLLDSTGGPNHVDNKCDTSFAYDIEKRVLSEPQPTFYYTGHFSRFLPQGSRRIGLHRTHGRSYGGHVARRQQLTVSTPPFWGENPVGVLPCNDGSTQNWRFSQLSRNVWMKSLDAMCLATARQNSSHVEVTRGKCLDALHKWKFSANSGDATTGRFISESSGLCLTAPSDTSRSDYLNYVYLSECSRTNSLQEWIVDDLTSEIRMAENAEMCLDAGGGFVQVSAFEKPSGEIVSIVQNLSDYAQNVTFYEKDHELGAQIELPAHSISTFMWSY